MVSRMWKMLRMAAFAAAALTLAACGGGGDGGGAAPPATMPPAALSEAEIEGVRSDDRVVRLGGILGEADALLLTSARARYSIEGGGERLVEDLVDAFDCTGARCEAADGTVISVADLTGSAAELDVRLSEAALGERGGFDAAATRGRFELTEVAEGARVSVAPTVHTYGFWGAHGYAALELGSGPLTGDADGTALTGEFAFARAYAAGAASGSNPGGTGSATWSGIVEASPVGAFERLTGSVTLTIADLARPTSVSVSVDVPGHEIDRPGWANAPLAAGRFSTGTAGSDYLEGSFHGPGGEEAWGVFDTTGYIGAFGAKRAP